MCAEKQRTCLCSVHALKELFKNSATGYFKFILLRMKIVNENLKLSLKFYSLFLKAHWMAQSIALNIKS